MADNIEIRTKKILDDNPDLKKQWTSLIPQGKMGNPEDLMGAVTFLSSDASAYVTGAYVLSLSIIRTYDVLRRNSNSSHCRDRG